MADNVAVTAGSGTTVAADDVGGVMYQRTKLALGADGSATDAIGGAGAVSAAVQRMTLASDDPAVTSLTAANASLDAIEAAMADTTTPSPVKLAGQTEYETVAASATAQVLGTAGATGNFISHLLVIPATTSPGNVLLLDNATSITVFTGGASSVSNLIPFTIPLNMVSVSGAWKVTTGANVSVIAVGDFT